ncbi:MAG: type II secretion system protein [Planctomycetota bacterium]
MPDLRTRPRACRLAFTLIELLVVISIIALLVARQAYCLSNQRSNGLALAMYANDHQETLPAIRDNTTGADPQENTFRERLNPYLSSQFISGANASNENVTRNREHWICPSMPEHDSIIDFGQYSANPNLLSNVDFDAGTTLNTSLSDGRFPVNTFITLNAVEEPSSNVVFCEGKFRNNLPLTNARQTFDAIPELGPEIPYRIQFPHARNQPINTSAASGNALAFDVPANGSAVTGYMDGHAKLTKIENYPVISPVLGGPPALANTYRTWITEN